MSDERVLNVTLTTPAVIPLPRALYESNGVIFELYQGGRPYQYPSKLIRWERLKTFAVSREGDLTFHVRVSQAHFETSFQ